MMNCEQARKQDLIEKYVAGQLPDGEMAAFEEHYFGCAECLEAVQVGQAIQLSGFQSKVISMPVRTQTRPRWMVALSAAAALILAALVGWRVFVAQPQQTQIVGQVVGNDPRLAAPIEPAVVPRQADPEPQLLASNRDLGAVIPLAYRPSVLRGSHEDSAERFRQSMESYVKHDYRQTVAGLSNIPVAVPGNGKPEEHVSDAGVQLYLGISQLMLNQNVDAIRSLRRAAAYGDTPYLENAHFFWAKALIRQKQYGEAAERLKRAVQLKGDRQAEAQHILEQLKTPASR